LLGQHGYWQQKVSYAIDFQLDVNSNKFQGKQQLSYTNHSPDTLRQAFFHLYLNAFQPGSDMDVRSRSIIDPDSRVGSRIAALKPDQVGRQEVSRLLVDGKKAEFVIEGTILEVKLPQPILPGKTAVFELDFQGQVPVQIRRTGRDNEEGIRYSMSQWYPKICAYDFYGWHANPYVGREFHGEWGDFNVKLTLQSDYVVAATGVLQNPEVVGYGYGGMNKKHNAGETLTWNFKAENVHDFVWAADPDFKHDVLKTQSGLELHFFYQSDSTTKPWADLPGYTAKAFDIMARDYGRYPYPVYSVIQGGDGGMEYPMATLITGRRSLKSLVGVTVHELIHSWFQGMLATNEALYPWMDEGFTSYASNDVMAELFPGSTGNPHHKSHESVAMLLNSGQAEPLTTHADHYQTNFCYGVNSYSKGEMLLDQLGYVMGPDLLRVGMKRYFESWKFKHPTPVDFMRIMEKQSGLELDWFFEYFLNTTYAVDYAVRAVREVENKAQVEIARTLPFPMPVELEVELKNGDKMNFYIPLDLMRGLRPFAKGEAVKVLPDWHWVQNSYRVDLPVRVQNIERVRLNPGGNMADLEKGNNVMDASTIKQKPWEDYEGK
jgi:hypothetical protein